MGLMEAKQRRQNLLFSATWPSAVHTLAGGLFPVDFWEGSGGGTKMFLGDLVEF